MVLKLSTVRTFLEVYKGEIMAEYKNGVNYRGNMPVEKDDVNPDVQTGRIVFVDEHRYTSDSTYKARVDKYIREGFYKVSKGSSSGDGGVLPDGDRILITEETITTEADSDVGAAFGQFSYSSVIKPDTTIVTFNSTEYECPCIIDSNNTYYYGGYSFEDPGQPDFSEYPFLIGSEIDGDTVYNFLVTENAGTYTIKIEMTSKTTN